MNELLVFLQSLPEAFKTGFIYSIMVMGVYLTYKILDFPDMSVDGTFHLEDLYLQHLQCLKMVFLE